VKDDRLYLVHIGECITRIEEYTVEGKGNFLADRKTQDAVLRNLQTMAESTQRVSVDLKAQHPEVDWAGVAAFRNVLVHDYLGLNLTRVWEIIERHLSELKEKTARILDSLK
jgi:uncharacterized protein with HEPN domain